MPSRERFTEPVGAGRSSPAWSVRRQDLIGEAGPRDVLVDRVEHAVHPLLGGGDVLGQIWPEPCSGSLHPVEAAEQPDTAGLQSHQIDVVLGVARPTSCIDGSRRAADGSGTSSIVRASRPVACSHQKMSMPR